MNKQSNRIPRSPYDALFPEAPGEHPIDLLIERRFPQRLLRRRIRKATEGMLRGLGENRRLYLALEKLWNDYHADRERTCFDLGFEQGARIGRAEALRGGPAIEEIRPLIHRVCQLVGEADLAPAARIALLLRAAWAFANGW